MLLISFDVILVMVRGIFHYMKYNIFILRLSFTLRWTLYWNWIAGSLILPKHQLLSQFSRTLSRLLQILFGLSVCMFKHLMT